MLNNYWLNANETQNNNDEQSGFRLWAVTDEL